MCASERDVSRRLVPRDRRRGRQRGPARGRAADVPRHRARLLPRRGDALPTHRITQRIAR